jgi:hypothetical protein
MFVIRRIGLPFAIALMLAACSGDHDEADNSVPVAAAAGFTVNEDSVLSGQLVATDADGDPLSFALTAAPTRGTLTLAASGAFVYRPQADVSGSDSFRYSISDGRGASIEGMATITVAAMNDPPVARHDIVRVTRSELDRIAVLANDTDVDGDPLGLSTIGAASVGTAALNTDNTVRIDGLAADFRGLITFSYSAVDAAIAAAANVAVFVDTAPFVAVYPRVEADGYARVGINDFVSPPRALTPPGTVSARLRNFRPARNGTVVVYVMTDPAATTPSSWFCVVETTVGASPACPANPPGLQPLFASDEYFAISADGRWVAGAFASPESMASDTAPVQQGLYLLDTRSPQAWQQVFNAVTPAVLQVRFSEDSRFLYYLGSEVFLRSSPTAPHNSNGTALNRVSMESPLAQPIRLTGDPVSNRAICGFRAALNDSVVVISRRSYAMLMVRTATPGFENFLIRAGALTGDQTRDCDVQALTDRETRIVAARPSGSDWLLADVSETPNARTVSSLPGPNYFYIGSGFVNPNGRYLVHSAARGIPQSASDWFISYYSAGLAPPREGCIGLDLEWFGGAGNSGVTAKFDATGQYCMTSGTPSGFKVNGIAIRAPFTPANKQSVVRAFGDGFDLDRGAFLSAVDTSDLVAGKRSFRPTLTNFAALGASLPIDDDFPFDDFIRGPTLFLVDAR